MFHIDFNSLDVPQSFRKSFCAIDGSVTSTHTCKKNRNCFPFRFGCSRQRPSDNSLYRLQKCSDLLCTICEKIFNPGVTPRFSTQFLIPIRIGKHTTVKHVHATPEVHVWRYSITYGK